MQCCPDCNSDCFSYSNWQDDRDDINRICANCKRRYTPEKEIKEKPELWEAKIYVTFRYNPETITDELIADELCKRITDSGGEILNLEIK